MDEVKQLLVFQQKQYQQTISLKSSHIQSEDVT